MYKREFDITFKAKCYQGINAVNIEFGNNIAESRRKIITKYKTNILEKFISSFDSDELFINRSLHQGKQKNDLLLFRQNDKAFDGAVGIISKQKFYIYIKDLLLWAKDDLRYFKCVEKDEADWCYSVRLDISSRYDTDKSYLLSTLLLRDKVKFNDSVVPASSENVFEYLLILMFKQSMNRALIKGFYKNYRKYRGNDYKIKGTIDINRHIKENVLCESDKIAYSYNENSYCNYLNQLILAAYDYLKKKYPKVVENNIDNNFELNKALQELRIFNPVISNGIVGKNNRIIQHPFYYEYEILRKICIMVLNGGGISLANTKNKSDSIQGFLFYIPDLWEEYLESYFDILLNESEIRVLPQGGKNGIKVYKRGKRKKEYVLQTYPDFVFEKMDKNGQYKKVWILDAKFKNGWDNLSILPNGKPGRYILEDYTKCVRDMTTINSSNTGVIYPTSKDYIYKNQKKEYFPEDQIKHSLSEYNQKQYFWVFPISIPLESEYTSYSKWKEEMDENMKLAMEVIIEQIKK